MRNIESIDGSAQGNIMSPVNSKHLYAQCFYFRTEDNLYHRKVCILWTGMKY
jgi:hypothetical protein